MTAWPSPGTETPGWRGRWGRWTRSSSSTFRNASSPSISRLFGFSRGAALARAFAIMLQKRCKQVGAKWHWDSPACPADIYFMGLWDTVASVGLPASSGVLSFRIAKKWLTRDEGLQKRRTAPDDGITPPDKKDEPQPGIALGHRPGAMPAPALTAGHMGWGDDLRLPPMTLKCVHFTAGHEVRNSFPLDSVREGVRLPVGIATDERVYPGVHSDVGGGYRPGEGGKSPKPEELMSLIPLNEMLAEAVKAGVPLTQPIPDDFRMAQQMLKRWKALCKMRPAPARPGMRLPPRPGTR